VPEEIKKLELTPSAAILIVGALIAGTILFVNYYSPAQGAPNMDTTSVRLPSTSDHIIGSPNAPIVLIEYSDLECPFCASIHPTLTRIVAESQGEVAWVYRHFPLENIHNEARPAAIASECIAKLAGNDAFWQFIDTIFINQDQMSSSYYVQIATELGASPVAFRTCLASGEFDSVVDTDYTEAVANGGNGTPFTIIVGKDGTLVPFSGALPYAQIMAVIKGVMDRQ
jgi:protein-disulfide isomerase